MTMVAAIEVIVCASAAATVKELNAIPLNDVTPENASEVFDAAVATTNLNKITILVQHGKVALKDAVHKTMTKKPFKMCLAAFNGAPAITNYTLQAEALASLNYADFDNNTFGDVKRVVVRHDFQITEAGQAEVARMYQANKLFGAEIYCSCFTKLQQDAFASEKAPKAYEAIKHLVKTCGCPRMAAIFWWYSSYNDRSYFESMYDKSLVDLNYYWFYNWFRPEYSIIWNDALEILKTKKPSAIYDKMIISFTTKIDKIAETKTATLNFIDYLSCTKEKLNAALYCNNQDKLLDVLVACDTSLEAKDIDAALSPINALDPDYKPAEVLKALKAVNQRYTLKLYDDRDAWEPVLSKIRAMIEVRQ